MNVLTSTLLLLGLSATALSQLGETKPSVATSQPSVSTAPVFYDEVVYDDYDSPDIVLNKDAGLRRTSHKSVEGTYQGCLSEDYITNGTYIYFNLTQDMKDEFSVSNEAEACFNLCLNKDPFSFFVSVNKGLRGSNDGCGCHAEDEIDLQKIEWDDSACDEDENCARIYCGPENIGCINAAPPSFLSCSTNVFWFIVSFLVVWTEWMR
ncbi:uncharacterized protein LOC135219167 [Macrobrachium nipponense]|uniref:uncharacterized protein LOC135219167 n=1 Tax=Macrobrachium nipponense TaxID=159736 RepID=UPI0030C89EDE